MNIIADTHTHTIASGHALNTITENIAYASKIGLKFIAITDHGPKMPGIWENAIHQIFMLPRVIEDVVVLRGVEANIIDYDGGLDIDEHMLKQLDWTIASFHHIGACTQPGTVEEHTNAYMNIVHNPYVDVIAHSGSPGYKYDYEKVIAECNKYNKLIEINEATYRVRASSVENCREIAKLCKKYQTKIVLNSDAHFYTYIGKFDKVIAMLEEIDFPQELIVNSSEERFVEHLKSRGRMQDFLK